MIEIKEIVIFLHNAEKYKNEYAKLIEIVRLFNHNSLEKDVM